VCSSDLDGCLFQAVHLPDPMPEIFLHQRVEPDQVWADTPIDHVLHHRAVRGIGHAGHALVGLDRDLGNVLFFPGPAQTLPPDELVLDRHDLGLDCDLGDLHVTPLLCGPESRVQSIFTGPWTLDTGPPNYPRIDPDNSPDVNRRWKMK